MTTLLEAIESGKSKAVRRVYIKRRDVNGNYEQNWFRIDILDNQNKLIDIGSFEISIDADAGEIANYEATGLSIVLNNENGHFGVETKSESIFYGYLNRKLSKIKIDAGYEDSDGNDVGVDTVFEGVIDSVQVGEDQKAQIRCLSYVEILNSYPISDLNIAGVQTVSEAVNLIMNRQKITDFIPYVPAANTLNPTIEIASYEGTYWDALKKLAQESNSIPYLVGNNFKFMDRVASTSVVYAFKGKGTQIPNIYGEITNFDDEGADRVYVYFKAKDSTVSVQSSDPILLRKYLSSPKEIDLANYNDANKLVILQALLQQWQTPRPTIQFKTKFMVNYLNIMDKITIKIIGIIRPVSGYFILDSSLLDGSDVLPSVSSSVSSRPQDYWMITKIEKNLNDFTMIIKAERVI